MLLYSKAKKHDQFDLVIAELARLLAVRKNIKKAYVRLKDGDSIKIFEEEEKK
jgi:hypothetical protein